MFSPFPFLHGTGWRRAGAVNTVFICILFLFMALMTFLVVRETQSLLRQLFFYEADCQTTKIMNLISHLILNILSTMVLSSSNFFMQVLNAPSRAEVDAAHARGKSVEIGVSSLRNTFLLSRFKALSWVMLAISSAPIHLFFNSAVFETDFQGKAFRLTIAAERFVQGGKFFPPGASLARSGFDLGYGDDRLNMTAYRNGSFPAMKGLVRTATEGSQWTRLDPRDCRNEYLRCKARKKFRDVIVVINTAGESNTEGWTRDEVFNLTAEDAAIWDPLVPANEENSLWFSARCGISTLPGDPPETCTNTCGTAFGSAVKQTQAILSPKHLSDANWTISFQPTSPDPTPWLQANRRSGFRLERFNDLDVRYCLAEPFQPKCKLGVSPLMLAILSFCIAIKGMQCLFVMMNLTNDPLVTPGDAVASFLSNPDPTTRGMCTLSFLDKPSSFSCDQKRRVKDFATPGPRQWKRSPRYLGYAIPVASWIRTYTLLIVSLGVLTAFCIMYKARSHVPGTFIHSAENGRVTGLKFPDGAFFPSMITANKPQILLSICYFAFNAMFTRFLAEREWNSYGLSYRSLRVTAPEGAQRTSYRLQLPYRFSIPLIFIGVMLHWICSNAFYMTIVEGGYLGKDEDVRLGVDERRGFDKETIIAVSYSVPALFTLAGVSYALVLVPVIMAFTKLKGDMVVAGADSRVMSASCHPVLAPKEFWTPPVTPLDLMSPYGEKYDNTFRVYPASPREPASPLAKETFDVPMLRSTPSPLDLRAARGIRTDDRSRNRPPLSPLNTRVPPVSRFQGPILMPPPTPFDLKSPWSEKFESQRLMTPTSPLDSKSLWGKDKFDAHIRHAESPSPVTPSSALSTLDKDPNTEYGGSAALLRLSRRKLRWGAIPYAEKYTGAPYVLAEQPKFGHLTFGPIESGVIRPEEGKLYE